MLNLKGGVKLKPTYSADDKFKPIIDMLQSHGANLSLLAYTSAKGFVFRLDVKAGNSAYLGYNRQGNAFTDEVLSLCLKLVVVYSPYPNNPNKGEGEPIADFDNFGYPRNGFRQKIHKSTESKQSLFDEARYQQQAWKTSIIQNGVEVCPPVCNLALLDSPGSKNFLYFLQNIVKNSPVSSAGNKDRSNKTITYLDQQIKPNYSIGILSMHTVINSLPFDDFTETYDIDSLKGLDMYKRLAAQTMRLFLQEKMIHCDLHTGNALVSDATTPPTCDIIDFGRVVRFTEEEDDQFFTVAEKIPLEEKYNEELETYFTIINPPRRGPAPPTKPQFVESLLNYIKSVDLDVIQRHFGLNRAQMSSWVDPYLTKGNREPNIFVDTFDNLLVPYMTRTEGRTPNTVTVMKWEGNDMINLNVARGVTPRNFIVSWEELGLPAGPVVSIIRNGKGWSFCDAAGVCMLVLVAAGTAGMVAFGRSGGTRRKHYNKKNNKTKRNKK
jgi:hypothetical protein